jgi:putative ABC transport system substrate-binding protein
MQMVNSARTLGLGLTALNASNPAEIDRAFSTLTQERTGGLIIVPDRLIAEQGDQIIALAARFKVPVMYNDRRFVRAGGLISYGANAVELFRIVGGYAARILNGEKPGDLPVQRATTGIELAINLKTAKSLGLAVPQSILLRADEVIE